MNMMRLKILPFLIVLLINTVCTNAQNNVEHYRFMVFRASPYGKLMGRHAIEADKIGYGSHFKIIRDAEGRLSAIEYWFRKKLTKGGYPRFGAIGGAAKLSFTYDGNKIVRSYLDEEGKPMLNYWKVAIEEIELDDRGHKKSMMYKDLDGNRIEGSRGVWEMNWQVSDDGKEVIEKRTGKDGATRRFNNFLDFGRVKMIFNEQGLRTETWNIDENGNAINSEKRQVAGVYTRWDEHTLDEKQITWVDANGKPKDVGPFEVMEGNYGFCTEKYNHDANGNTIGLTKYNTNGDLVTPDYDGNVFDRNIYDDYGFLIDQRYFNSDGVPSLNKDGIARLELIRDSTRLVTQVRFYGLNGELKNRQTDGVATINLLYDEEGKFLGRKNFDSKGGEVISN